VMSRPLPRLRRLDGRHTIGGAISLEGASRSVRASGRVFARDGGGPMLPTTSSGRGRAADPLVRLVRIQPGQHAVRRWTCRASVACRSTPRWPRARPASWRLHRLRATYKWDLCADHQRLPRRPRRHHLPVLLGEPDRAPSSSGIVAAFVVVYGIDASGVRARRRSDSARCPVHMFCGIWGTLSLGLFATGQYGLPTPTGADVSTGRQGPLLRRRHHAARVAQVNRQRRRDRSRRSRWRSS
jgi:Amt family ammonium transporter